MTRTIHGHHVRTERCDGLRHHHRVFCDGRFCGLVCADRDGWHTIPRSLVGVVSPPVCHAPSCELALASLVAETFS